MLSAVKRRNEVSQALCFRQSFTTTSLHKFLNLALIVAHDGLEAARFQNDTTSEQDDVAAASQERNAVCDKDSRFCREQSARSDNMICGEFTTQLTLTRTQWQLTVDMTRDVGINSGQHIIQQYQVSTSVNGTGKSNASPLATTQLLGTSNYFSKVKNAPRTVIPFSPTSVMSP